ncbi:flagellar hook-basal body complex protein [Devosia sp.]|uniref:flagellar hook-basal body complex protein n=1 Tax=Devosia sp. TaxID=1871048 RepID=UPI003BAC5CBA
MGIYGALSTAVTGLRAQSFALENVSGNIANSQTIGFKRIDTDFVDLIPDAAPKRQTSGSVLAQAHSTNNVQGDVKGAATETYMAINGNGFFVVEPRAGQADGSATFSGANFYTRRGDFELDKSGYLVNGAGYYLKGLPIDAATQNISGSVPQVLQVSNAFLPAQQTTRVNYELNLPQLPKTPKYQASQSSGSELLSATDFMTLTPDQAATTTGAATTAGAATSSLASAGETLTIQIGATSRTYTFNSGGSTTMPAIDISDTSTDTIGEVLAAIQADLVTAGATGATVGLDGTGKIAITAGNATDTITVTDGTSGTSATGFNLANGTTDPTVATSTALAARVATVTADQTDDFLNQSVSGGAITVYSSNGAPAQIQMRWAKVNSTENGGAERWNLFVLTNGNATGSGTAWTRMGGDYTFGADGSPSPAIDHTDLPNLTVNGVLVGDIRLQHGAHGLTQFADPNGTAEVTTIKQNGYPAGEFVSVAVNDSGRVVVSYNNGQQLEVAQVVTANFNAVNQLKRMDGGLFAATSESGEPILDNGGGVIGSSLEASNTDISEEFTKLIVTQQAYAAGTKIVSTADEMLQQALNMLR